MARGSQGLPGTAALRAAGWGRGYLATPSPRLSPWASLSFVVRRRPSRQSGPSPPPRTSLRLRCRPPFARSAPNPEPRAPSPAGLPPCLSLGPCFCPPPLLSRTPPPPPAPPPLALNIGVCLSVCLPARGAYQATDDEAGMAHPSARSSRDQLLLQEGGGSLAPQVNGCCWPPPLPHVRAWAHSCLLHHPLLRPRLQETGKDHKPGVCRVWVFPFSKYLQLVPTVDVEVPRSSGAILPHSSLELRGEPLAVFQAMRKDSRPLSHS